MWNFFINNRRFTIVLIITLAFVGLVTAFVIPKESNPEVDFPVAIISTPYIGASAEDVEELVTNIIEDKIANVDEVQKITSTSSKGMSGIVVEFNIDSKGSERIADLKDKVDKAKYELPEDAEDPIVEQISFENEPIIRFSLSGPFSVPELKNMAEQLKGEIERVAGVSKVEIIGGLEREVQVIVDKALLDKFSLPLINVTNAIRQANTDIPIGSIQSAGENFSISFAGRIKNADDIKNIPIVSFSGTPIFVKDVADVVDGFCEASSISRLSLNQEPSQPAISLNILKSSGSNILKTADGIEEKISRAKENYLPESINIEITHDMAKWVRKDLGNLTVSGLETIVIVMLLLFIFVGWRESLLAGVSIPLTFLITFLFLGYLGYTLNFITLFSLILALGILVDGAIVVIEGMNRKLKEGLDAHQAAIETVNEFKTPLISGTLTTVFAFLPMVLTSGIIGKFIRTIPITVSLVLLSSLFVALGVITTLASKWLKKKENLQKEKANFMEKVALRYENSLRFLFKSKKTRRKFVCVIIFAFIFSISLPAAGFLSTDMFPPSDFDYFMVNIEQPVGTPLEETAISVQRLEYLLLDDKRIKSLQINVGYAQDLSGAGMSSVSDNIGSIVVNLVDEKKRKDKSFEIAGEVEEKIKKEDFGRATIQVQELTSGPPTGAPIEMSISGPDLIELEKLSLKLANELKDISGVKNVSTSIKETNGEFVINIDRVKAQIYGVSATHVAMVLRNAISGIDATVLRDGGNDTDVLVKYSLNKPGKKSDQINFSDIESLTLSTSQGEIPLSFFTESFLDNSRNSIYHKDGKRTVRVFGYSKEDRPISVIIKEFKEKIEQLNISNEYLISFGGEQEDMEKSFTDMLKALVLGIFAIAMLLILQFNSYRQPLFILATIPLSLIGVFCGLTIMDQSFSFPGAIGVVALAGIVVNNAIILIDKINRNRREGLEKEEAIIIAAKSRLQPILLTTITTVAGVLPLALSNPMWSPIAYSIIFGLLFSTILTLVVVPMLYRRFGEKNLED